MMKCKANNFKQLDWPKLRNDRKKDRVAFFRKVRFFF
jgi:hypothetical protein